MNIVIAADHRGFALKEYIKQQIGSKDVNWIDVGTHVADKSDYPTFGIAAIKKIQTQQAHFGILLCGSGIGMSIVANRFKGIYAGLVWNMSVAREAKEDDNINVLVLPADYVSPEDVLHIISMWMTASFKGGHYQDRITLIDSI